MRLDVLDDENGDMMIVDNDIVIGEADNDYANDIIISAPGDFKETPTLGVFIQRFLQGPFDISTIEKAVREQLRADGYPNARVTRNASGQINIAFE